jgi:hypothetical protein
MTPFTLLCLLVLVACILFEYSWFMCALIFLGIALVETLLSSPQLAEQAGNAVYYFLVIGLVFRFGKYLSSFYGKNKRKKK